MMKNTIEADRAKGARHYVKRDGLYFAIGDKLGARWVDRESAYWFHSELIAQDVAGRHGAKVESEVA